MCIYAYVHAFSSQIEYVPVSGVGVDDYFVCRNEGAGIYAASAATLSTDFFVVRFLNERTSEEQLNSFCV